MSSAHALVHVGEPRDLYYTDEKNCLKQSVPVDYNTRYSQNFTQTGAGTSVFTIPPNQGVRHCVIVLGYNAGTLSTQNGAYALERGWGYSAIEQISFRIGGSSQYFLTGAQLLARNLRLCRTKEQRNSILSLGGSQVINSTTGTVYAYIPVSIWATPGDDGIGIPLPGDLLSQQIQITAQLKPSTSFWLFNSAVASPVAPPTQFDVAYFQIEQLEMKDRGMALNNRINMDEHMYAMPLPTFDQQEFIFQGLSGAGSLPITLTGFRAGEVKKIQLWLVQKTKSGDSTFIVNPQYWVKPQAVTVLYAGLTYSVYNNGSSAIWNLLDGTSPSAVDQSVLATNSTFGFSASSGLSEWVELPFSQPTGADYEAEVLVHGKEITNGIVNLQVTLPDATNTFDLHVVYVYNASVGFSKGTAELIF